MDSSQSFCLLSILIWSSCINSTLCQPRTSPKILIYPVGHCYNSLLLDMEKLASFLSYQEYNVSLLINDLYTGSKGDVDMSRVKTHRFSAPRDIPTLCDMEQFLGSAEISMWKIVDVWMKSTHGYCEALLKSAVLSRIKGESFDLLIIDRSDWCSAIIAESLDIPFMTFVSVPLAFSPDELVRYVHAPSIFSQSSLPMNFLARLQNVFIQYIIFAARSITLRSMNDLRAEYNITTEQCITSVYSKSVINLLNSDQRICYPYPLYEHEIEIGAMFPAISSTRLPQEIAQFIDDDEAIIVSFGTQISFFKENWKDSFVKVFEKLPYRVIWRTSENIKNSSNILCLHWIPQTALLASKKVRLLITHGGVASTTEAIYFGVPMIVIPMQDEQSSQAVKLSKYLGVALALDPYSLTENTLQSIIEDITGENSSVKHRVTQLSMKMRHAYPKPQDMFLHWIKNTITDLNNAKYDHKPRRPPHMHSLQWLLIDVLIVFLLIPTTLVITARFLCKALFQLAASYIY